MSRLLIPKQGIGQTNLSSPSIHRHLGPSMAYGAAKTVTATNVYVGVNYSVKGQDISFLMTLGSVGPMTIATSLDCTAGIATLILELQTKLTTAYNAAKTVYDPALTGIEFAADGGGTRVMITSVQGFVLATGGGGSIDGLNSATGIDPLGNNLKPSIYLPDTSPDFYDCSYFEDGLMSAVYGLYSDATGAAAVDVHVEGSYDGFNWSNLVAFTSRNAAAGGTLTSFTETKKIDNLGKYVRLSYNTGSKLQRRITGTIACVGANYAGAQVGFGMYLGSTGPMAILSVADDSAGIAAVVADLNAKLLIAYAAAGGRIPLTGTEFANAGGFIQLTSGQGFQLIAGGIPGYGTNDWLNAGAGSLDPAGAGIVPGTWVASYVTVGGVAKKFRYLTEV